MREVNATGERITTGSEQVFPDCVGLGGGSGESDLAAGGVGVEKVFGNHKIAQGFEQEAGQKGEVGDAVDEVAPGQELHKQVRELEHLVEIQHHVEVVAVAEVFEFVAGLLFVEAFVFNLPA